jgi:hypothetical protein
MRAVLAGFGILAERFGRDCHFWQSVLAEIAIFGRNIGMDFWQKRPPPSGGV